MIVLFLLFFTTTLLRIDHLQMLDEFEEYFLLLTHYCVWIGRNLISEEAGVTDESLPTLAPPQAPAPSALGAGAYPAFGAYPGPSSLASYPPPRFGAPGQHNSHNRNLPPRPPR